MQHIDNSRLSPISRTHELDYYHDSDLYSSRSAKKRSCIHCFFFLFDIYVHVSRVLPQAAGDLSSCSVSDVPFFGLTTLGYGVK